jgi:mono/diheme cytochrome c family protein
MQRTQSPRDSWQTGWTSVFVLALLAVLAIPATASAATDPGDDDVTFTKDVERILQENCQVCHQPDAIGPMALTSYEEVRPWAPLIREAVVTQKMPPYQYDTGVGIQELQSDMRLSQEEIETIVAWVDAGAPQGDLADAPPPVEWPDPAAWGYTDEFGEPDLIIRSAPFDIPAYGQDIWWRPTVDTGILEDRCMRAIQTKPVLTGRGMTHHANSVFVMPGEAEATDDDDGGATSSRLSEYALGKLGEIIPSGACRTAPAGSQVRWDIHYYPNGEAVEDHVVEVGIWLYPEDYAGSYRQDLRTYGLQGDIDLAPGGTAMTQGFHSFDHPVRIDSWQPHGHLRMVAASLEIFYPDTGRRQLISMVSNWSALWHHSHVYDEDVAPLIPAGAVMVLTQWYDNTANNPINPDPTVWVGRGSRTTDEMSHNWIAITHLDQEGYEKLVAEREAREEQVAQAND